MLVAVLLVDHHVVPLVEVLEVPARLQVLGSLIALEEVQVQVEAEVGAEGG